MLSLAYHFIKSIIATLVLLLAAVSLLLTPVKSEAQSIPGDITIAKGGEVWIEGKAGPVPFTCRAESISGQGKINNRTAPKESVKEEGDVRISVALPVKSLDCGKSAMNRDMYNALRANKFPSIKYHLLEATLRPDLESGSDGEGWMNIQTRGILEIAGVQDTTGVWVIGKAIGEKQFQVKGEKHINMDTFDIEPPSKMFGLIRADKNLEVHFDVTVTLEGNGQGQTQLLR